MIIFINYVNTISMNTYQSVDKYLYNINNCQISFIHFLVRKIFNLGEKVSLENIQIPTENINRALTVLLNNLIKIILNKYFPNNNSQRLIILLIFSLEKINPKFHGTSDVLRS